MSIFNDKALKGVAEAAAKIMAETSHELKGNQHKIDANKNGKIDAHDFKLLRGKKDMKKEEVGLDEAKTQSKDEKDKVVGAVTKAMRQSYANVMQGRNERSAARMNAKIKNNMKEEVEQIDELSKDTYKSYLSKSEGEVKKALGRKQSGGRDVGPNTSIPSSSRYAEPNTERRGTNTTKAQIHAIKKLRSEEVEQLDEVGDTPAGRKTLGSYVTKAIADKTKDRTKGLRKATSRMYKDNFYGKKNEEVEATEQEQLNEAFPTVADAKKRMDAGKTATGSVTKTATGLVHKRDYKDDDNDDTSKKSSGYGARQNYKRSTRVNESASFTEMLELYNEHGLKVLAPIETEEMDIDGTTIEVIDGDKINGFVQTTVEEGIMDVAKGAVGVVKNVISKEKEYQAQKQKKAGEVMSKLRKEESLSEEPTNDEFTKEYEDQKASFEGKKKQPKVAAGKTTGVKTMPESVELDERELTKGEAKKKEDYVMGMKKKLSGFKQRYGERAKSVMYATATKMAKKD